MPRYDIAPEPGLDPVAAAVWNVLEFGKPHLLKQIEGLTPEQLAARPAGFKNSLATLVCHVAGSEISFAHTLLGREMPQELKDEYWMGRDGEYLRQAQGETVESLTAKLEKARAILKEALATVRAADLDRVITRPSGVEVTVRWLLALIAHHASLHIGQMQMLRQHLE